LIVNKLINKNYKPTSSISSLELTCERINFNVVVIGTNLNQK